MTSFEALFVILVTPPLNEAVCNRLELPLVVGEQIFRR